MGRRTLTYGAFLAVFLGAPLLILVAFPVTRPDRRLVLILAVLSVVAVLYTAPWDSAIIANGVWTYGVGRVWGTVIARVPLEEYTFYILQVFLTGIIAAVILRRMSAR